MTTPAEPTGPTEAETLAQGIRKAGWIEALPRNEYRRFMSRPTARSSLWLTQDGALSFGVAPHSAAPVGASMRLYFLAQAKRLEQAGEGIEL